MQFLAVDDRLARFHRPAGNEDRRDVEAQGRHQHPRGDLVAVGNADQRIGAVGVDHVFDAVGDEFPRRQAVEHAGVAHGDAVVHRDRVEFLGHAAGRLDLARHQLPHVLEVDVARHELGEGIGDGDDRLAEIAIGHACGAPQGARAGHVAAVGGGLGTVGGHGGSLRNQGKQEINLKTAIHRRGRRGRGGKTRLMLSHPSGERIFYGKPLNSSASSASSAVQ